MMKKKVCLFVLTLVVLGPCFSQEAFTGTWVYYHGPGSEELVERFEFHSDGTGMWMISEYGSIYNGDQLLWETDGRMLTVTWLNSDFTNVFQYEFTEDGSLILEDIEWEHEPVNMFLVRE
jgi:hypothetical protein